MKGTTKILRRAKIQKQWKKKKRKLKKRNHLLHIVAVEIVPGLAPVDPRALGVDPPVPEPEPARGPAPSSAAAAAHLRGHPVPPEPPQSPPRREERGSQLVRRRWRRIRRRRRRRSGWDQELDGARNRRHGWDWIRSPRSQSLSLSNSVSQWWSGEEELKVGFLFGSIRGFDFESI